MGEHKIFYLCDPAKHVNCRKSACYIYGGPCRHTSELSCAMSPEPISFELCQMECGSEETIPDNNDLSSRGKIRLIAIGEFDNEI